MDRIAIVLMNLGGPDTPAAVKPFLFNLFKDPAIIGLPNPFRWLVAKLISRRRAPEAEKIYAHLGGGSPLLPNTQAQGTALESALQSALPQAEMKTFIAMRYWHPLTEEAVEQVMKFQPTEILLLPLYPHFSTTTVGSSVKEWHKWAKNKGVATPTKSLCCYPTQPSYIGSLVALVEKALEIQQDHPVRLLFSAHGLPKRVIDGGDPYQSQIEKTAAAVMAALKPAHPLLEWRVCYQSRVGPLQWITPFTDQEIIQAGKEGVGLILIPIAFVSEHSETLVELDLEYKELAHQSGVPSYVRVPTPSTHPIFIQSLVDMVHQMRHSKTRTCTQDSQFTCASQFHQCPRLQSS
jgi:ferrochelatase